MQRSHHEMLHEQDSAKLDAILEYVADIPDMKERLQRVENKVDNIDLRLGVVESVVKIHSRDIASIKRHLQIS